MELPGQSRSAMELRNEGTFCMMPPMQFLPPLPRSLPRGRAVVAAVFLAGAAAHAAPRVDSPHPPGQLYFDKYCLTCHDETSQKGGLNLEDMPADFSDPKTMRAWIDVYDKLSTGQMPPKKKERPEPKATGNMLSWLKASLTAADLARRKAEGRVVLRRLNREEYQNTIRDLLDVSVDVKDLLPEDASSMGFDNIGEALAVSSVLMERYLEAADVALDAAIVTGPRPETKKWNVSMYPDSKNPNDYRFKTGVRLLPDETFVYFNSGDSPIVCDRFKAPTPGRYRIRLTCYAYQSEKPVTMGVIAGSFEARAPKTHPVGWFDLLPDKASAIEFTEQLPQKGTFKVLTYGLGRRDLSKDMEKYEGPGAAVSRVEAEGPLIDAWPPASHQRLFGGVDLKSGTLADAEKVLREFAPRAFRRPVTDAELAPFLAVVKAKLDANEPFEQAIRVGLKAVLCAPEFLFLKERPARLGDFEIASRLSYFLWSSMPDDELMRLATRRTLSQPAVLRAQVEWMLKDAKARAFTENFTGQWLQLRQIDFTTPDKKLYPEHDVVLQDSLVKETHLFFDELLKNNLSLLNFVQSDFSILNSRLAQLYGIPGVTGQEFRKVALPPESHRGGVLTQASVLKVTANGTVTSPVVRGAWVMRNIVGRPPKPPPPNVPAVEPDIRGAKTIREQLDKHRSAETCAACHATMDPPGFALENFDVIGGWRENYRSIGEGKYMPIEVEGRRVGVKLGPKVDASGALADGRKFENIDEFKKLLLEDKDQIARCLAEKLLVYGTGGALGFSDREVVDGIVARTRAKNYGFRTLIHEVVESRTFLSK
jgi:uncharacterized protein DUF1592/uncharacterized protein DUF1588/uncharacterized protein DUF1587/uncharacterized protein DUF1585/uncharacterized protein DUF1595/cytochrome c